MNVGKVCIFVLLLFLNILSKISADYGIHTLKRREDTKHHELTSTQKKLIVEKHNELRRIVQPPAADMLYMSWDNRLEKIATEYTRKCLFEHNPERKLDGFSYVGENLHVSQGRAINDDYGANAVISWDDEKKDYTYNTKTCAAGKVCGHYTQTAWAKSYKVGCGMTTCDSIDVFGEIWKDATVFACNYAPGGNYGGQMMYIEGSSCSKCSKYDKCVEKLCTNSTRDASGTTGLSSGNIWKFLTVFSTILQLVTVRIDN